MTSERATGTEVKERVERRMARIDALPKELRPMTSRCMMCDTQERTMAPHPMSEPWVNWQPIKTAPVSGAFLVCSDKGLVCPCQSYEGHRIVQNMPGWLNWEYGDIATKWAPFPPAPDDYATPT